jgi:hypothetical protein
MGKLGLATLAAGAAILFAGVQSSLADDLEQSLLQKFQRQNQKGALYVKEDVEKNLLKVTAMAPTDPERALDLLRQTRDLLDNATGLPKADREALARMLDDGFRDVKARLESRQERARVTPEPTTGPVITFQPNIVAAPIQAQVTATPIVSPDRRWVRFGFNGTMSGLGGLFFQPVQFSVPNVLQGPGRGFTIRP